MSDPLGGGGADCGDAGTALMADWDTSLVTDMSGLFSSKGNFNQNISGWDVSKVTDMSGMFEYAYEFNQDLSSWKVGAVTDMSYMFESANRFANTADLSGWDVSKVTNMNGMFQSARLFNATGLGSWDVSKVTDMSHMFSSASKFNDDISNWNVGQVQQMHGMFWDASIINADITGWKPKTECTDAEQNSGNCYIHAYMKGTVIIRTCSEAPRCGSMRTPTAALTTPTTRCARRRRTRARARFTTGRRTRGSPQHATHPSHPNTARSGTAAARCK